MKLNITGKSSLSSFFGKTLLGLSFGRAYYNSRSSMDFRLLRPDLLARAAGHRLCPNLICAIPFCPYGFDGYLAAAKNFSKCQSRQPLFTGKRPTGKNHFLLLHDGWTTVFGRYCALAAGAHVGAGLSVFIRFITGAVGTGQTSCHL